MNKKAALPPQREAAVPARMMHLLEPFASFVNTCVGLCPLPAPPSCIVDTDGRDARKPRPTRRAGTGGRGRRAQHSRQAAADPRTPGELLEHYDASAHAWRCRCACTYVLTCNLSQELRACPYVLTYKLTATEREGCPTARQDEDPSQQHRGEARPPLGHGLPPAH